MKPAFSDEGIILRVVDFAEADKKVGILSHYHGYQEYLARGARRLNSKKAPHLDLFNQVKFQAGRGESPQMLLQAETQNYFPQIKNNFEKTRVCLSLAEIITNILPFEQEDKETYLSLANYLHAVNDSSDKNQFGSLTNQFSLYLLKHLGYPPPPSNLPNLLSDYFETIINKKIISRQLKMS